MFCVLFLRGRMLIKQITHLVLLLLLFVAFRSEAQKVKPKYIFTNDTFYSDKVNVIAVVIPKLKRDIVAVNVSQGRIYTNDKQLYLLDSLRNGSIIISLIQRGNNKKIVLEKRRLMVTTSPEQALLRTHNLDLELLLGGYKEGQVPDSIVKKATRININKGYLFNEAIVYLVRNEGFSEPVFRILKSELFDEEFLLLLKKIKPGTSILFDEIKFQDINGNKFIYPKAVIFKVEK
jgi:hypothetical protein